MPSQNDQVPFDLGSAPSYTRDDLVVSSSNAAAVALIDGWPQWPMPWAILVGSQGCGKTHLAAIWRQKSDAMIFEPDDLSPAVEAAQSGFSILIDGLSPDKLDETGLFHLMNAVRAANASLLLTALSPPERFGIRTPDLKSRLKSAIAVKIDEPDDALVTAVIVKLFADRQIEIDPAVVDYLVIRVERSLATLNFIVQEIDKAALAAKAKITKPFVGRLLKAHGYS